MQKLTREQAAILGAFTGITCGPFEDIRKYAAKKFKMDVNEMDNYVMVSIAEKLKEKAKQDFLDICA